VHPSSCTTPALLHHASSCTRASLCIPHAPRQPLRTSAPSCCMLHGLSAHTSAPLHKALQPPPKIYDPYPMPLRMPINSASIQCLPTMQPRECRAHASSHVPGALHGPRHAPCKPQDSLAEPRARRRAGTTASAALVLDPPPPNMQQLPEQRGQALEGLARAGRGGLDTRIDCAEEGPSCREP
jgi:hypothetical protein